jgi:hypothetical protein
MNTTYLLLTLIVIAIAVGGWIVAIYSSYNSTTETVGVATGIIGSIVSLALVLASFGGNGTPTTDETTSFSLERTPYRVILKAFDREVTFTDAFTVANADRIERVRRTTQHNAWGLEVGNPTIAAVFKETK